MKHPENPHALPAVETLAALDAETEGLSEEESRRRLEVYGPNHLPEPPRRSTLIRFLLQFHNILIYVLLASAGITAFLQHWFDTAVILAVVIVNAIIGFIQEGKAEKAMDAIRHMLAPRAAVLRQGVRHSVDADRLVPGDIVLLEAGDKVPADIRLLQTHGFRIQEAILTGESVPVEKQIQAVDVAAPLGDRFCMAYSGTLVASGQARGVVVATGSATEIGRISGMLDRVETLVTPLVEQIGIFARWLTGFILVVAALLLVAGHFLAHFSFAEVFMAVVGLTVSAIPEGLPAVLTITLAMGVQAMARRNAIVRRLPAIETIGAVNVICTDKTGTLTRNEMTVVTAVTIDGSFGVDGVGYAPEGDIRQHAIADPSGGVDGLRLLGRAAALCNDAALHEQEGGWNVEGDPMEGALLAFAGKTGISLLEENAAWVRCDAIPFDARHRFMATLNHDHDGHACIFVKGAPERILAMCASQRSGDGRIGPVDVAWWQAHADSVAAQGQRVLALAMREMPFGHAALEFADVEGTLVLLGLVGMIDPPRPEAIEAVAECHRAGIRVKMITGDHAGTARAIGRQIGLRRPDGVLTGAQVDELDDDGLKVAVLDNDVFARTSPEHKLRLVMALQAHGMTVAMTGDGVNDAPALKRADAGIAMGLKGSEAAREAAELVLADDNFASIVAAVREGRTVYDNIRKVISWTLPTNAGEAMTIIVALLFGMTLPVTPVQILWVNLITATTLGIALAFEPTEAGTMRRKPRARHEPLLGRELLWHIVLVSLLFLGIVYGMYHHALDKGHSLELARTMAVNTLVVLEIFHLFFIRNIYGTSLTWKAVRGTPMVWIMVLTVTAAQFAITYIPLLQRVFATESVPLLDGLLVVATGVLLFFVLESEKQVRLRWLSRKAG